MSQSSRDDKNYERVMRLAEEAGLVVHESDDPNSPPSWHGQGHNEQFEKFAALCAQSSTASFTTRELAQEMLRQFNRDIPNTVVQMLRVVLGRFVETGEYIDDIGMLIGKQPTPPLGVQRWELYAKELQEKLAESATASAESAYERARREHPEAGRCKCGQHGIPARFDGINWYWQRHSREGCTLELPNSVCWCGLLRHEHTDGHQKGVESPLREQNDIQREGKK